MVAKYTSCYIFRTLSVLLKLVVRATRSVGSEAAGNRVCCVVSVRARPDITVMVDWALKYQLSIYQ